MRNHLAYSKDTTLLRAHIHTFLKKKIQKKRKIVYDFKRMRRVQRVVDGFPNSSFLDKGQELPTPPSTLHHSLHNFLQYKSVPIWFLPEMISDVQK